MLKNWPDEETSMTGIAAATPPRTGGNCCHHWGMGASFRRHTLVQPASCTNKMLSSQESLLPHLAHIYIKGS